MRRGKSAVSYVQGSRCCEIQRPPGSSLLILLLLASSAAAQDNANWNTSTGTWNNAANWDCVVNGVSSHCVPADGFVVTNIGGDITLDINRTIKNLLGTAGS